MRMREPRNLLVFLLLILLPSSFASAQQPWEGASFSGNARSILAAAEALVKSGEESTVVLFDERRIVLDSASRVVETRRLIYRVGSGEPEHWSNVEAVWRAWQQER